MPFFDGYELIRYALDAEQEEKMYLRWAIMYQTTMSFEEFKAKLKGSQIDDGRSAEEILEDVKSIIG